MADIGGITGSGNSANTSYSYNSGKISGHSGVGGIVGQSMAAYVYNSYNLGEIVGVNSVGGVVGSAGYTVYNCYNRGSVSGSSYVAGIMGSFFFVSRYQSLHNCPLCCQAALKETATMFGCSSCEMKQAMDRDFVPADQTFVGFHSKGCLLFCLLVIKSDQTVAFMKNQFKISQGEQISTLCAQAEFCRFVGIIVSSFISLLNLQF